MKRILAPLTRHPLIATGVLAALIAIGHAVWICLHRRLGAIDPDEAGYLTAALSFQRSIDPAHPQALLEAVLGSATAPLVPLLSVATLIIGPRNIWAAMMIQPILMTLSCVAIAGITRRWAGPLVAIAAGVAYALTPTVVAATDSYWLGLGAATAFICALWALVASEQGTNRWIWAYGFGLAAMMLSRTMMLGLLPGTVLAGLIVCWSNRRGLTRFLFTVILAAALAGPWWYFQWSWTIRYLTSYGYGKRAALFGQGTVLERIGFRFERITDGIGASLGYFRIVLILVALLLAAGLLVRRLRAPLVRIHTAKESNGRTQFAVFVAVAAGFAALVTTTNNGVWFELPVIAGLFPLIWFVVGRGPTGVKVLAVAPFAVFAVVALPAAWWIHVPGFGHDKARAWVMMPAHYEYGFGEYDSRFLPKNRAQQTKAAAEWWAVSERVERALHSIWQNKPNVIFYMSGNFEMFNTNTVGLAAELHSWTPTIWVPDTTTGRSKFDQQLRSVATDIDGKVIEPRLGATSERILVLIETGYHLFTPDAEAEAFADRARRIGWKDVEKFDLPRGGTVSILRFPEK